MIPKHLASAMTWYNRVMSETITLKLKKEQEEKLFETWKEYQTKTPPYARWQLRPENCVITCYESGKTVFQGKDANVYASAFNKPKDTNEQIPQAGSDEVGTGDYFGPVCVCATAVDHQHVDILKKLGVKDSKAINDEMIQEIAPKLIEELPHSLLIVDNKKYNSIHKIYNMNEIKAILHNQAYVNLSKKIKLPDFKVVDQFAREDLYYHYLRNEPTVISGIHFETKAENKYLAVASASIIARYAFIRSMDALSQQYHRTFEKGAGAAVDQFAKQFVKQYGFDELKNVAKLHFKNTEKLL